MKRIILLIFIMVSSVFLSACSMAYEICIVNESDENLDVIVLREDVEKNGLLVMDKTDWQNNGKILYILLDRTTKWKEISNENIKEIPVTSETIIRLKPNEILRYESVHLTSENNPDSPHGSAKQFRLSGKNGEILLKGENFYRQFEKGGKGIFFAYK